MRTFVWSVRDTVYDATFRVLFCDDICTNVSVDTYVAAMTRHFIQRDVTLLNVNSFLHFTNTSTNSVEYGCLVLFTLYLTKLCPEIVIKGRL